MFQLLYSKVHIPTLLFMILFSVIITFNNPVVWYINYSSKEAVWSNNYPLNLPKMSRYDLISSKLFLNKV